MMLETKSRMEGVQSPDIGREIEHIRKVRGLDNGLILPELVSDSWRRCIEEHELLPDSVPRAEVLTHTQVQALIEERDEFLRIAEPEVERLFLRLVDSEYLVSLASTQGAMLLFRCDYQYLSDLAGCGVLPGSIWTEERQGTNGVGTCLRVGKPVTIVGNQHYGDATQSLTCLTAPVLGRRRAIESVLNVTTARSGDARINRVVQNIVERTASRIENLYFNKTHSRSPILRIAGAAGHSDTADEGMIALDENGCIVDGSSQIKKLLGVSVDELIGARAEDLIEFETKLSNFWPDRPVGMNFKSRSLQAVLAMPSKAEKSFQARFPTISPMPAAVVNSPVNSVVRNKIALRRDPVLDFSMDQAKRLLSSGLPLIITGETGSGKTLLAQNIAHDYCGEDGQVVSIDCASLMQKDDLDVLFAGVSAHQKTCLILDRLDELGPNEQISILSLIETEWQSGEIRFGIIVTSVSEFEALGRDGAIRKDLLHRLKGGNVVLAPLRSSPDLESAIRDYFHIERENLGKSELEMDESTGLVLKNYHWPGNIRELKNALRHAIALADRNEIRLEHLPNDMVEEYAQKDLTARSKSEASKIEAALRYNNGNVSLTARYLGVSRATLYRKIQIKQAREDG